MTMLADLTNRVNGQEKESAEQLDALHHTPAKPRAEPRKFRWQSSLAQDLDLEETVQRSMHRTASASVPIAGGLHIAAGQLQ